MFELLIYEKEAPLAFITVNRPQAMNALSNALVEELTDWSWWRTTMR